MKTLCRLFLLLLPLNAVLAELSPEQRSFDFQTLAALYAKRYAPYEWKRKALGFDLYDIRPWLERVRTAKDDLEFYEIEAEYVASLQDSHSGFSMTSNFIANLGMTVDIYDGKVLIDFINRSTLPQATYPFGIGDELVSVDGKPVEEWIALFSRWRAYGNPAATRRAAAGAITWRAQSVCPRAAELGATATVVVRRANGESAEYTIPWTKSGFPVLSAGKVPMPAVAASLRRTTSSETTPAYLRMLEEMHQWRIPEDDPIMQPIGWAADETGEARTFIAGQSSRTPVFRAGFPESFVTRLGRTAIDFHYSGIYTAGERKIGYIRIPSFSPSNQANAIAEFEAEIDYMEANTDGLVIDVMRNGGGGCYMLDVAARLIPYPFYFFGEEIRATQDRLNSFQSMLESAQRARADDWIIGTYQGYVDQMQAALQANRGMTEPIAACARYQDQRPPTREDNQPARTVYTRPMIVLIDEFSISAADIFPSMIQDNRRAPLVGMRTNGGGGSVSRWQSGFYSESQAGNTNTLVVRRDIITTPDLPPAPYVENIGARPDIELNYMTADNLLNGGKTFVQQFTAVLTDLIGKGQ